MAKSFILLTLVSDIFLVIGLSEAVKNAQEIDASGPHHCCASVIVGLIYLLISTDTIKLNSLTSESPRR